MLKISNFCIPITLDCNLHCKYCFRKKYVDENKKQVIPQLTEDMINYLKNLNPEWCKFVTITGGEPLLQFSKIKEIFRYVPDGIHKKIISNCTLLTQEIVDYINENHIMLQLSHDGPKTAFLRGIDVLENAKIRSLLQQVKILKVSSVITKYNVDIWENFFYIAKKIGRIDFEYGSGILYENQWNHNLIDDFDYETWFKTWSEFELSSFKIKYFKKTANRYYGFDILPNGTVCSNSNVSVVYGSIYNETTDELLRNLIAVGDMDFCIKSECKYKKICDCAPQEASQHLCKCRKIMMDNKNPIAVRKVKQYLSNHLSNIMKKYGYNRE